ncbi:MAG: ribosomal protein L7/L12 [Bacteroidota bacterium]
MEAIKNILPKFEANQVLTSQHLNDLVEYLDQQERLTRSQLIGIGNVCGLRLERRTSKSLTITKGCGITSEGRLITLPEVEYTHILSDPYEFPENVSYDAFDGLGDMHLLLDSDVLPDARALKATDLDNQVLVLFLECYEKELKNCEGEDCMEKGIEITYTIRPLLMSKNAARQLIQHELTLGNSGGVPSENALRQVINGRFALPVLSLPRPALHGFSDDIPLDELSKRYTSALTSFFDILGDVEAFTDKIIKDLTGSNFGIIATWRDLLANTIQTITSSSDPDVWQYAQYVYDISRDLIDAYNEMRASVFEYVSECCPDTEKFPKHLRMGAIPVTGAATHEYMYPSDLYRHRFAPSHSLIGQHSLFDAIKSHVERWGTLIQSASISVPEEGVKITPSKDYNAPLWDRAIPIYYQDNNKLRAFWSYENRRKAINFAVLSYHWNNHNSSIGPSDIDYSDPFSARNFPLAFNFDDNDFFRIEGHIGQNYQDAFEQLLRIRELYNLPFDVMPLRLSLEAENAPDQEVFQTEDLESLYETIKSELACLLEEEENYFLGVDTTKSSSSGSRITGASGLKAKRTGRTSKSKTTTSGSGGIGFLKGRTLGSGGDTTKAMESRMKMFGGMEAFTIGSQGTEMSIDSDRFENFAAADGTIGNNINKFILDNNTAATIGWLDLRDILGTIKDILIFQDPERSELVTNIMNLLQAIYDLRNTFLELSLAQFFSDDEGNTTSSSNYYAKARALINQAKVFRTFAKSKTMAKLETYNVIKGELLDYLDRIIYECDFTKLNTVYEEYQARLESTNQRHLLADYFKNHPGIEHKAGVEKHGTFILVYDEKGVVRADFSHAGRCCSKQAPMMYVLNLGQPEEPEVPTEVDLIVKVFLADGNLTDKATVKVDGTEVPAAPNGSYRTKVSNPGDHSIEVSLEGHITQSKVATAADNPLTVSFFLVKEQPQETSVVIGGRIINAITGKLIDDPTLMIGGKAIPVSNGKYEVEVASPGQYTISATADGLQPKNVTINVSGSDVERDIKMQPASDQGNGQFQVLITRVGDPAKTREIVMELTGMTATQAKAHLGSLPAVIVSGLTESAANEIGQMIKQQTASVVKVEKKTNRSTPIPGRPSGPGVITRPGDSARDKFDITLTKIAPRSKMKVIKVLREELGLSLIKANALASSLPSVIAKKQSKTKATKLVNRLKAAGGTTTTKKSR